MRKTSWGFIIKLPNKDEIHCVTHKGFIVRASYWEAMDLDPAYHQTVHTQKETWRAR